MFPVSSSVHRWLTGAFCLRAGAAASLAAAHDLFAAARALGRVERRGCRAGLLRRLFTFHTFFLLRRQLLFVVAWRGLFKRVLHALHVKVAANYLLLRILVFFVKHAERIY